MEDYVKPNLLLKDELDYELKIRSVVTDKPIEHKRKILGRLLVKERENGTDILKLVDPSFGWDTEKAEINSTIDSIKTLISDFEGPTSDSVYIRARARICHLTTRISRLNLDAAEVSGIQQKNEWYAAAMYLDADLHEKVKEPYVALQSPSTSFQNSTSAPNIQASTPVSSSFFKSTPVHKLGISFNGEPKNVLSFIERIEETAHSRHISKTDLFESASDLFSDKAIFWLRHVKASVRDWDSLISKLKADFLDSDIDDDTWRQIREKRQSKHEPVILYIAVMEGLFNRLSYRSADVTKIKYIKRGLQKEYQQRLALQDINSIEDLGKFCKRLEEADVLGLTSSSHSRQISELCYDRSNNKETDKNENKAPNNYNNNKFSNSKNKFNKNKNFDKNKDTVNADKAAASNKSDDSLCWKCGTPNHIFKYCRSKVFKKFCFKCGTPDVTTKTCNKCSSKNA